MGIGLNEIFGDGDKTLGVVQKLDCSPASGNVQSSFNMSEKQLLRGLWTQSWDKVALQVACNGNGFRSDVGVYSQQYSH